MIVDVTVTTEVLTEGTTAVEVAVTVTVSTLTGEHAKKTVGVQ